MRKRISRILVALAGAVAIQFLSSMSGCGCPDETVTVAVTRAGVTVGLLDNSGREPRPAFLGRIAARALGISMTISTSYAASFRPAGGMGPHVAWATPPCHQTTIITVADTVRSVRLRHLDRQGNERDAGDDFIVIQTAAHPPEVVGSIQEFARLPEILNRSYSTWNIQLLLRRNFDAVKGDSVRFILSMEMNDGRIIADTTEPVGIY